MTRHFLYLLHPTIVASVLYHQNNPLEFYDWLLNSMEGSFCFHLIFFPIEDDFLSKKKHINLFLGFHIVMDVMMLFWLRFEKKYLQ